MRTRQGRGGGWVGQVYAHVPPPLMASADRALRYGAALMRRRIPITCFEGPLAGGDGGGERVRVVTVDTQPSVAHFVQPLFEGAAEPRPAGHTTWRRLPEALDRLAGEADLILARLHADLGRRRLGGQYLRMPEAVECIAEVPVDGPLPPRARRGQASNLRQLRRSALRWELSHDAADFDRFYRQMYVPFAQHRFGDLAYVRGAQRLRSHFLRGGLIRVLDGNQWVGGTVYSVDEGSLRVWVVGIADGDTSLINRGVMVANWAFSFELAHQLGARYCHMGLTRPSLADGIMVYKKRWGAALREGQPTHCDLFARWDRFSPAVARLLSTSPLIFHDGPRLSGLVATDEPAHPDRVERLAVELAVPGLRRMCVLTPEVDAMHRCELKNERVRGLELRLMPRASSARLGQMLGEQHDPPSWMLPPEQDAPLAAVTR